MTDPEQPSVGQPIVADAATGIVRNATRQEAAEMEAAPLGKPSRKTVSAVWVGIVYGNLAVMLLAAIGLTAALFLPASPSLVEPSMMLVLFTTPAAFLAGLIARDPGQHS